MAEEGTGRDAHDHARNTERDISSFSRRQACRQDAGCTHAAGHAAVVHERRSRKATSGTTCARCTACTLSCPKPCPCTRSAGNRSTPELWSRGTTGRPAPMATVASTASSRRCGGGLPREAISRPRKRTVPGPYVASQHSGKMISYVREFDDQLRTAVQRGPRAPDRRLRAVRCVGRPARLGLPPAACERLLAAREEAA
jgi:hypothetical protein